MLDIAPKDGEYMWSAEHYYHSLRVGRIAPHFAHYIGEKSEFCYNLGLAGLMHDIGKFDLNPGILNKNGRLTAEEFEHVKKHIDYGKDKAVLTGLPNDVVDAIYQHHENFDGSGYLGLREFEITDKARMLRILDVYDALRSKRSYKAAFSFNEALAEMEKMKKAFDPRFYEQFLTFIKEENMNNETMLLYGRGI